MIIYHARFPSIQTWEWHPVGTTWSYIIISTIGWIMIRNTLTYSHLTGTHLSCTVSSEIVRMPTHLSPLSLREAGGGRHQSHARFPRILGCWHAQKAFWVTVQGILAFPGIRQLTGSHYFADGVVTMGRHTFTAEQHTARNDSMSGESFGYEWQLYIMAACTSCNSRVPSQASSSLW